MLIAAISGAAVILTVTMAMAIPAASNTPLYTVRMEQASSQMNFLPTERNTFTYSAEKGVELNYDVTEYCSIEPLSTHEWTCVDSTCGGTLCSTCVNTCGSTCKTCPYQTCGSTCYYPTCQGC